jgi:hypothetical protein
MMDITFIAPPQVGHLGQDRKDSRQDRGQLLLGMSDEAQLLFLG